MRKSRRWNWPFRPISNLFRKAFSRDWTGSITPCEKFPEVFPVLRSQVRGDRTNFPLFNDYLSHLERYGRGGRIKDPFRDSRPTDDRHERYNNSMPSVLVRSDNAAETALFEERARLWDALSKCDIDETITERFSCVLCKNGCQGLGQLVEHVTSKAHTSTAVLFHSRDAVMTLPINGTKDKVVKFDVKDLRHWIESAPGSGEATVAAGGREVVDATTMG